VEVSGSEDRKVEKNASPSDPTNANRRGRPHVAGESLHSHGRQHQVHFERGRGYRRGAVAARRIWVVPLPFAYPRRIVNAAERTQQEVLRAAYQN
jgi:hypothetical protein